MDSPTPLSRKRSLDQDSDSEDDSEDDSEHGRSNSTAAVSQAKLQRTATEGTANTASTNPARPYTCSLPPLCSTHPTSFPTSHALSSHYAKHHTNVCSVNGCGKLFPDERFLDLHIREFHDPIVALQRENGKKTYACFAATCDRKFSSPKKRRLHLIDAHKYPKEYFFALPMHGLEELYARFGDSASLVGPVWKGKDQESEKSSRSPRHSKSPPAAPASSSSRSPSVENAISTQPKQPEGELTSASPDPLSSTMNKLTLVPNSLRFGRGKGNRFIAKPRPRPTPPATSSDNNKTGEEHEDTDAKDMT